MMIERKVGWLVSGGLALLEDHLALLQNAQLHALALRKGHERSVSQT